MFHYQSCGLPDVWLKNGYKEKQTNYGRAVAIHDVVGLHRVLGLDIIENQPTLTGAEVRFLRKELDLPQTQLAQLLVVSESTVRAWENNRQPVNGTADRMLRVLYQERICGNSSIRRMLDRISQLNREAYRATRLELEETEHGWKTAA